MRTFGPRCMAWGSTTHLSGSSLAFIGNASAHETRGEDVDFLAEAFSIRRLEGSRWRLRRTRQLWGLKAALVPTILMKVLLIVIGSASLGFRPADKAVPRH